MKSLIECFKMIMTGNREVSRKAAREVRKLVYSSGNDRDKYQDIKNIINSAPDEYLKILEEWRQENFVMALSVMYFLHDKENQLFRLDRISRFRWCLDTWKNIVVENTWRNWRNLWQSKQSLDKM